ncbi:MAG: AMP-binding protein [Bacillaceae bacterium]|nr:AMP-binding protein [Bacillaceae bacterium]
MRDQKITELIQYAYQHADGWKKRLDEQGIRPEEIRSEADLSRIAVLRKDQLPGVQSENLPFGGLATLSPAHMARIFMSPGPIYDPQASDGDYWRFADALLAAGFGPGDIVQNTFSYHLSPAGFMFDSALRKIGASVIPAGVGNSELQVQMMRDVGVNGFVGTPSFLAALLDKAEQSGVDPEKDLRLQKAFFTAEMLPDTLRRRFENLGIRVSEGYGTADAGCIAYQTGHDPGMKITESAVVQICDPNTGDPIHHPEEVGEIVVTLLDRDYPLIRFGTGDLSRWVEGYVGQRMAGVLGRVGDGVKVRGMFVHRQQIEKVLEEFPGISYFQAVVTREDNRDQFTIQLECEENRIDRDKVAVRLKDVLRVTPSLEWSEPGSIDRDEPQLADRRKWD